MYAHLRREGPHLVVAVDGRPPATLPWPESGDRQWDDTLVEGIDPGWRALPTGLDEVRTKGSMTFGELLYHSFGAQLVDHAGPGECLFVTCDHDAATLPLEAIGLPRSGWPVALAPRRPSIIRTVAAPTDSALWLPDGSGRVLMADAIGNSPYADEHGIAIERCVTALGAVFERRLLLRPSTLTEALAAGPEIVHLLAHGGAGGRTVLLGTGAGSAVPVEEVAEWFCGGSVRVAILNTCESSGSTPEWQSLAHHLVDAGVPVVLAARRPVGPSAMAAFAHGFYAALAGGESIDECVRSGRRFVAMDGRPLHQAIITFHSSTTDFSPHPRFRSREVVRAISAAWREHSRAPFLDLGKEEVSARPATLLRPRGRAVGFVGRDAELQQLRDWRDRFVDGSRVSLAAVVGGGGSGKTRLALELVEESIAHGWVAGFVTPGADSATHDALHLLDGDVLVVVDYADSATDFIVRLVSDWQARQHAGALRVLALARPRPGRGSWLRSLRFRSQEDVESVVHHALELELTSTTMPAEHRHALLEQAVQRFADVLHRPPVAAPAHPESTPLRIHAQAFLHVIGEWGADSALGGDPFAYVLSHERTWWRRELDLGGDADDAVDAAMAIASLCGEADAHTVERLLALLPYFRIDERARYRVAALATTVMDDGEVLPCHSLAETHLAEVLADPAFPLAAVLAHLHPTALAHALHLVARTYEQRPMGAHVAAALVDAWPELMARGLEAAAARRALNALYTLTPSLPHRRHETRRMVAVAGGFGMSAATVSARLAGLDALIPAMVSQPGVAPPCWLTPLERTEPIDVGTPSFPRLAGGRAWVRRLAVIDDDGVRRVAAHTDDGVTWDAADSGDGWSARAGLPIGSVQVASRPRCTASVDGSAVVVAVEGQAARFELGEPVVHWATAIGASGHPVAAAAAGGTCRLFAGDSAVTVGGPSDAPVVALALSRTGEGLAVARTDGTLTLHTADGAIFATHSQPGVSAVHVDDDAHLVTGTVLGELFAWTGQAPRLLARDPNRTMITAIAAVETSTAGALDSARRLEPRGTVLAAALYGGGISFTTSDEPAPTIAALHASGHQRLLLAAEDPAHRYATIDPDGVLAVSGDEGGQGAGADDVGTGRRLPARRAHRLELPAHPASLCWLGGHLVIGCADGSIHVVEPHSGVVSTIATASGGSPGCTSIAAYVADGVQLLAAVVGGAVVMFRRGPKDPALQPVAAPSGWASSVAWTVWDASPRLAIARLSHVDIVRRQRRLRGATWQQVRELPGIEGPGFAASPPSSGRIGVFATSGTDHRLVVADRAGERVHRMPQALTSAAWSGDTWWASAVDGSVHRFGGYPSPPVVPPGPWRLGALQPWRDHSALGVVQPDIVVHVHPSDATPQG